MADCFRTCIGCFQGIKSATLYFGGDLPEWKVTKNHLISKSNQRFDVIFLKIGLRVTVRMIFVWATGQGKLSGTIVGKGSRFIIWRHVEANEVSICNIRLTIWVPIYT